MEWVYSQRIRKVREDRYGKSEEKRISEEAYDINEQTIYIAPK